MTVRTQASLGKGLKEVEKEDFNLNSLFLATITKVNYKYQTVEIRTKYTYAGRNTASKGEFSVPFPKDYIGKTPEGALFGSNNIIVPGSVALVGFLEGDAGQPFIINIYGAPEDNKRLTPNPLDSGDFKNKDVYRYGSMMHQITPALTYEYLDGEGTYIKSFNGKSFLSITSQEDERPLATDFYTGTVYEDLYTSYYGDGSEVEPRIQIAPNILFKHTGEYTHDGDEDNHVTTFNVTEDGTIRVSVMNTETQERTTQEMDSKGNYRVKYQGDDLLLDEAQVWVEYGIDKDTQSFYIKNDKQEFEFTDEGVLINGTPLIENLDDSLQEAFEQLKVIQQDLEGINSLLEGAGKENLEELIRTAKEAIEISEQASRDVGSLRTSISEVSGRVEGNIKKLDDYMKTMQEFVDDTNTFMTDYNGSLDNIKNIELPGIKNTETKYRHTTFRDIKIHADLPFKFEGYDDLRSANGVSYYYPQGLCVDDDYYYFLHDTPELVNRLLVVYDKSFNLVRKYYVGFHGGENIHVGKEGTKRYLYAKTVVGKIGKFDITDIAKSTETVELQPIQEYEVILYTNFFRTKEGWGFEGNNLTKGANLQRDMVIFYNHDFSKITGTLWIPASNSTLWSNKLIGSITNYSAKKQGLSLINNTIVQVLGGNYMISRDKEVHNYHMQGVQEISPSGQIMNNYTYHPQQMIDYLRSIGKNPSVIEHESAFNYNNRLFSIIVYVKASSPEATTKGILLVEYGAKDKDTTMDKDYGIAFTAPTANYNPYKPNINGNIYNEYTGAKLETIKDLVKYMHETYQDKVIFYTSNTSMKDYNGVSYGSGIKVTVENLNNYTYFLTHESNPTVERYVITKDAQDNFNLISMDADTRYNGIDLLGVEKSKKGYSINTINIPEGVSASGWFNMSSEVTVKKVVYQPYNGYDSYMNIYTDNQWQGWKKITTVE